MKKFVPLLLLIGLGACSTKSPHDTVVFNPTTTTTTVPGYNWNLITRANDNIANALGAVAAAANDQDASALRVQCGILSMSVAYYQGLLPTPNVAFNNDIGAALNHLSLGASYCKAGDYSLTSSEFKIAAPYVDKAKADLNAN